MLYKAREKLLEIGFDLKDTPANMTWTTLFSRFVRRYRSCYASFDGFVPKETPYSKLLNNCYLLGLDTELIIFLRKISKKYFQSPTHSISCIQNSKKLITKQQNEVNFWWKIENIV